MAAASILDVPDSQAEPRYLTTGEIARQHRVSTHCVVGWIKRGVVKHGVVVRLEGEQIGRCWRVTVAALADFRRKCNPETWRKVAEEQERERKAAKRDVKRVKAKLGMD